MENNENEQERSRQRSSVDRVNDLIDKAKQARNIKKGYKAFKTARKGHAAIEAGGALLEGGETVGGAVIGGAGIGTAGAVLLIILFIIGLIIIIFIVIFGGVQNTRAGVAACETLGGTCATSCQPPDTLDTTGASCSASLAGVPQVCCISPQAPPPNTNDCGSLGRTMDGILCWGKEINAGITPALGCTLNVWNRHEPPVIQNSAGYKAKVRPGSCDQVSGTTYFCTNEVGDAYNLAGVNFPYSQWVPAMMSQWNTYAGRLTYSNNVRPLLPGDAVFWYHQAEGRFGHTDLIYSITISDSTTGDGVLYTIDSNVRTSKPYDARKLKHYVRGWVLLPGPSFGSDNTREAFGMGPR
ncbi:MAG TPA: hypothetical protein VES68_03505 [Candidatus Sulfotelmatobacter sp.]|nr:hypothetical protein [Candidatus Sulfotelmatobacter sp.]